MKNERTEAGGAVLLRAAQFFIVHCSLFIVHCSLFIVHCSLFIHGFRLPWIFPPQTGYNDSRPHFTEDPVMLCEQCHGQRILADYKGLYLCPECGGRGETHCCDGLQEQPPAETAVKQKAIAGKVDPRHHRRAS
jgi:hypothetical protein